MISSFLQQSFLSFLSFLLPDACSNSARQNRDSSAPTWGLNQTDFWRSDLLWMPVSFLLHTFPIIVPSLLALCMLKAGIVDCVAVVVRKEVWFRQSVPSFTRSMPYTKIRIEQARCLLALSPDQTLHGSGCSCLPVCIALCASASSFMSPVFICSPMVYMWNLLDVKACWWCEQSYRHMFTLFSSALAASCSPDLAAGAFVKCPHASSVLPPSPPCQTCTLLYFSLYPNHSPPNSLSVLVQFVLSSHSGRSFDIKNVMHFPPLLIFFYV